MLPAHEQPAIAGQTDLPAPVKATETGAASGDIRPRVAPNTLMAIRRTLIEDVRERVLVAAGPTGLAAEVRRRVHRRLALLEKGSRRLHGAR